MSPGPVEVDRVRTLREGLTATGAGIYLATHLAGPLPAESMAAVHESDEMELRVGRVGPDRDDDRAQREKEARAVVAAALKASPERLVLTHGSAEAARLVTLLAAEVGAVDRTVVMVHERLEPAVATAIGDVAAVRGWQVSSVAEVPAILPADLALVALPHVDRDGRRLDIEAVGRAARAAGGRSLVDLGMSVGALPFDASATSADIVIADTHRWLLGPEGIALAWLAPTLADDLPERLRAGVGPFARGTLLSLARSVGWLLMYIELPWLIDRTTSLANDLHDALAAIEGVHLEASGAHGAVVAFGIDAWDAAGVAEELSRGVFAIVEADEAVDLVRASVGGWNREDEIARFVGRVAELAAHTPETLPRKPSLTVLSGPADRGR